MTNPHKSREGETVRRTDDLGRIVLPTDLRRRLGISPGTSLIMRKAGPKAIEMEVIPEKSCILCRSGRSLFQVQQGYLCKDCLLNLLDEVVLRREPDVEGDDPQNPEASS